MELPILINLQATARGYILRKRLVNVRKEFEEIYRELEPDTNRQVVWPTAHPCALPRLVSGQLREGGSALRVAATPLTTSNGEKPLRNESPQLAHSDSERECCSSSNSSQGHVNLSQTPGETSSLSENSHEVVRNVRECDGRQLFCQSSSPLKSTSDCHMGVAVQNVSECLDGRQSGHLLAPVTSAVSSYKAVQNVSEREDGRPHIPATNAIHNHDSGSLRAQRATEATLPAMANSPQPSAPLKRSQDIEDPTMDSIWSSFADESCLSLDHFSSLLAGQKREELEELHESVAMELLWVEQAIQSRKQYLRLRQKITTNNVV